LLSISYCILQLNYLRFSIAVLLIGNFLNTYFLDFSMVSENMVCTSCKTEITNIVGTTRFKCPKCGKQEIIRCERCRRLGVRYKCEKCGFEGPN